MCGGRRRRRRKRHTALPQLTEDDLQDPDLLGELGEVSGGVDFGAHTTSAAGGKTGGGGRASDYVGGGGGDDDDDDDVVEPDRESDDEMDDDILAYGGDAQEEVGSIDNTACWARGGGEALGYCPLHVETSIWVGSRRAHEGCGVGTGGYGMCFVPVVRASRPIPPLHCPPPPPTWPLTVLPRFP